MGAFFYSYIAFQVPSARLAEIYGAKWVVALSLCGSGVVNIITPFITWSMPLFITSRVILGAVQSAVFPASFALMPKWFSPDTVGVTYGLHEAGAYFGSVVTAVLTGYLGEWHGWPSAFYVEGQLNGVHVQCM